MADENVDSERLITICDWIGLTLPDPMALAKERMGDSVTFTPDQEAFFGEHIPHYSYFGALNRGHSPDEIAEKYRLSKRSTARYLKDLESVGLIERHAEGRIRLLRRGLFTQWDDRSPIGKRYTNYFIKQMASRALDSLDRPTNLQLQTGSRGLTAEQFQQFTADLSALSDRYRTISAGNMRPIKDLKKLQFLFIVDDWHVPFFDEIPNI